MPLSRKHFVAAATAGLSGAALLPKNAVADAPAQAPPSPMPLRFHVLRPNEYDRAQMFRVLRTPVQHKQVFESVTPLLIVGNASVYIHMQNSLNAYEFSYGYGRRSLATLAVLAGPSAVLGLDDAMWTKYGLGKALNLAETNVYYTAKSVRETGSPDDPAAIYQDWSAEAVMRRGGRFFVCHNAMTAVAALAASQSGGSAAAVLADFERHVVPGFIVVPAAVAAVQAAQDLGWRVYPII